MATKSNPTPAQIEQMRAEVKQYDADKAEAERIEKEAFFAPLKSALDNDCGRSFYASLEALRASFDGDEYSENANFRAHLDAILTIVPNFYAAAGVELTVPVEATPETPAEA